MKIFELDILGFTLAPTYYWLMYALWFIIAYQIIIYRKKMTRTMVDDLFLYVFGGVILGGRLWYIVFYNLSEYLSRPLDIFKVWEWGMSFHGWMLGVIVGTILFSKIKKISFLKVIDEIALTVPIGLWLGRIGNYLNGELLGYSWYTGPFAIDGRFPSPRLEAFLEWLVLIIILYFIAKKQKFAGQLWAVFLIWYWFFRMIVEIFFRTPDAQLGYIIGPFSMWAILSLLMLIAWIIIYIILNKKAK